MEQKLLYEQQRRNQMTKKKRRRIRRIRVYFRRTALLCFFLFFTIGAINLGKAFLHRIGESKSTLPKPNESSFVPADFAEVVSKNITELTQMGYDEMMLESLYEMSADNKAVTKILNHIEDYPEELLDLLSKNSDTIDFVQNYPNLSKQSKIQEDIDISDLYSQGSIPFFFQWDTRWGYCQYGSNYIALAGCGPTCLSMVYVGLTGDTRKNPGVMSAFSEENGFIDSNNNTMWALMTTGAQMLGLNSKEISLDQNTMIDELEQGHPIILSMRPGDFTTVGHFIVISSYQNGKFVVHDPNSKIRSEQLWDFDTLSYQIKNLWSFSF